MELLDILEDSLGSFALYLVAGVIGLTIGLIIRHAHKQETTRTRPAGEERDRLIAKVNGLRKEGRSYEERKKYLLGQGLNNDNTEELLGDEEKLSG